MKSFLLFYFNLFFKRKRKNFKSTLKKIGQLYFTNLSDAYLSMHGFGLKQIDSMDRSYLIENKLNDSEEEEKEEPEERGNCNEFKNGECMRSETKEMTKKLLKEVMMTPFLNVYPREEIDKVIPKEVYAEFLDEKSKRLNRIMNAFISEKKEIHFVSYVQNNEGFKVPIFLNELI